jgi:hypothetical protein
MDLAKQFYVRAARSMRDCAGPIGLLDFLESRRASRLCLYLRSLFSVYDAQDLARLDLPWWSFDAIDYVEAVLADRGAQMSVFEYGSGASTLWLSKRCRSVHSVEHDPEWAAQVEEMCSDRPNVTISTIPAPMATVATRCRSGRSGWTDRSFDRYVEFIRGCPEKFDLIIVDGRARTDCLVEAKGMLNKGGLILFDDSHRARYQQGLLRFDMPRRTFHGLVPGLPMPGETTIFGVAETPCCPAPPGTAADRR